MVITRKIEVFVCEDDKDARRAYYQQLQEIRDIAVKVANMTASHLFILDNTIPYLSEEDRQTITFLGVKGTPATRQNAPYVAASELFKGKVGMNMVVSIQHIVSQCYQEDRKKGMWNRSLRSYKGNMPIPYHPKEFRNLRFAEYVSKDGVTREGCFFTLAGIPFQMRFGRDRSANAVVVRRLLEGEYKMCTSSLKYDIDTKKWFLLLCVEIPQKEVKTDPKKVLYARLDVQAPIVCSPDAAFPEKRSYPIGTAEEFLHRRLQIQAAVRRCQMNNKYTDGGKGRRRKTQALDRWHDKEINYVSTKLHIYSRTLVDLALKHGCGTIRLVNQGNKERSAKEEDRAGDHFVLRNWSYFGLKEKISYKCKMVGITLTSDKETTNDEQ